MKVQFIRGTNSQNDAYTGPVATVSMDTDNLELRLHDGVTVGGVRIPNANHTHLTRRLVTYNVDTDGNALIADRSYTVASVRLAYSVASGTAVTLTLSRESGTEALGSGDVITTFEGSDPADTVYVGTLTNTSLVEGDRLGVTFSSSPASLDGMCLTIELVEV